MNSPIWLKLVESLRRLQKDNFTGEVEVCLSFHKGGIRTCSLGTKTRLVAQPDNIQKK